MCLKDAKAIVAICSSSTVPRQTHAHPYHDGQSRAHLHQLLVLTQHRSSLVSCVEEQQHPENTKHSTNGDKIYFSQIKLKFLPWYNSAPPQTES